MKAILSAIVTLSAVAAFAAPGTKETKTTTTTTAPAATAPAATTGTTATTTTTTTTTGAGKEAKAPVKAMTKEEAEKTCSSKKADKAAWDSCVKEHTATKM